MRDWLTLSCGAILIAGVIGSVWFHQYPHSQVYACNDVDTNPPEIVTMCKSLTKNQWWGTYYERK
jgi:hypothetical protein